MFVCSWVCTSSLALLTAPSHPLAATQIDGMHSCSGGGPAPRVMVLAATNFPWDLDEALRRWVRWNASREKAAAEAAATAWGGTLAISTTLVAMRWQTSSACALQNPLPARYAAAWRSASSSRCRSRQTGWRC